MNTILRHMDTERRKKALLYTVMVCGAILLLFFLISWKIMPPAKPVVQDLIEINLGNLDEGYGEVQPLIKGQRSPSQEAIIHPKQAAPKEEVIERVDPDENAENDAAAVTKTVKKNLAITKEENPTTIVAPVPKPQKPKVTYNGPGKGTGNDAKEDNGYRYQGNKLGGKGDAGDPNGNPDSYGKTPGGKIGGPRVISGNRKIIRYYSFTGELPKATIYAVIKVSPSGQGTFVSFAKGSTSQNPAYAQSISNYLRSMQFDKGPDESRVTVQFNFNIN